jgi:tripartite-type tricarboxylate transporter receptor subunit TctC
LSTFADAVACDHRRAMIVLPVPAPPCTATTDGRRAPRSRCRTVCTALAVLVAANSAALAQTAPAFPVKPVRVIVPFAPGGANDVVARLVAPRLSEQWAQSVVIENRPGAGATLGMELVAKSAPDGYTLGAGNQSSLVIGPLLNPRVGYDPVKDLTALGSTATTAYVVAVNPGVPARSIGELIKLARAKPGFLSYGTAGSGTISHIGSELLFGSTGTKVLHVPYKGAGPYLTALIAGEIDIAFVALPAAEPFARAGKVRLLAAAGATRSEAAPTLPTLAEGGVRIAAVEGRYGLVGPAGMSRELVLRINASIGNALKSSELRQRLLSQGFEPLTDTPEQYSASIRLELETFARVIRSAGIKADG